MQRLLPVMILNYHFRLINANFSSSMLITFNVTTLWYCLLQYFTIKLAYLYTNMRLFVIFPQSYPHIVYKNKILWIKTSFYPQCPVDKLFLVRKFKSGGSPKGCSSALHRSPIIFVQLM